MTQSDYPPALRAALLGEAAECATLVGVSVYDDEGRFVAVNARAAEILGYDRAEVVTRDVADFTPPGIDRSVLLRPELREGVRAVQRKDGASVPVAFVVTPTRVGAIDFYVAFFWELDPADPRAEGAS